MKDEVHDVHQNSCPDPSTSQGVLVVVDGQLDDSLRAVAKSQSLTVLDASSAEEALREIMHLHPPLVVVLLGNRLGEGLKLIHLAASLHTSPVIAVAHAHDDTLERSALIIGASYYVPSVEVDVLIQVLEAVSAVEKNRSGGPMARDNGKNGWHTLTTPDARHSRS